MGVAADPLPPAAYLHRGTRAIQRLVEFAPSTGGLALWVRHQDVGADAAVPVVTDGLCVRYGPGFEDLSLPEQAGWVAHEVLHIALRHPQRARDLHARTGELDQQLFNICADAIVNSALGHLAWLQLPEGAVTLERLLASALHQDSAAEHALLDWDVERLYRALDDREPPRGEGRRRGGQGGAAARRQGGGGGGDEDSDDEAQPHAESPRRDGPRAAAARALGARGACDLLRAGDDGQAPEDEAEQARLWSERLTRAHAGDGAHSMLRTLLADLPRSHTPWEQVLRTQLARALAPQRSVSWSRPSRSYIANQGRGGPHRRMPFEPGFSPGRRVPRLVVVVDVSGSVDDALMARFTRELQAIVRRLEAGLVLVVGDDRVQRVQRFAPGRVDLGELACGGGGGTDFTPLLQEADQHDPDSIVVLTDLEGPARCVPRAPVIWAVPEAQAATAVAPFGRLLVLR